MSPEWYVQPRFQMWATAGIVNAFQVVSRFSSDESGDMFESQNEDSDQVNSETGHLGRRLVRTRRDHGIGR